MPEDRKFTKIRLTDDDVHIEWFTIAKDDRITSKLHSADKPLPGFRVAMKRFKPEVLKLLKLPTSYESGLEVRAVNITHETKNEDELRGITIHALKTLEDFNSPLNLHTPYLREASDDSEGKVSAPSFLMQLLDDLEEAANEFIDLKRGQRDAFEAADDEDSQGELEEQDAELETAGVA